MRSGLAESAEAQNSGRRGEQTRKESSRRWTLLVTGFGGIAILIAVIGLSLAWPFTRENVIKQLELATTSAVTIGRIMIAKTIEPSRIDLPYGPSLPNSGIQPK